MARPETPVTALTVALVYLLALFGSYCQMAPAVSGDTEGWTLGSGIRYKLTNTLLFSETSPSQFSGDVGFVLTGEVAAVPVWQDPTCSTCFLLKIELRQPQLWIKSRRAPEPEGFVKHRADLDKLVQYPVLAVWKNGRADQIFLHNAETTSSANFKRGLVNLFRYNLPTGEDHDLTDASGSCRVTHHKPGPYSLNKWKMHCVPRNLFPSFRHPNPLLGAKISSSRNTTYELTYRSLPRAIHEEERHEMTLIARPEVGTVVTSKRTLELLDSLDEKTVQADTLQEAVIAVQPGFRKAGIEFQFERRRSSDNESPTLEQTLEECRSALETSALGTAKSASAFLKLLPLVESASPEVLAKILKSPRNRQIRQQLLDLYGASASSSSHEATMKVLRQDEKGDDTERYLWALSLSPKPDIKVAEDILKRSEETHPNDKISETIALTAACMARHLGPTSTIFEKARNSLELGLDSCAGEECKLKFIRALRNLRSEDTIPTLLEYATGDNKVLSVAAWKALSAMPRNSTTAEVKKAAKKTFFQIGGPKRDSSARTLALDIILESTPSMETIRELVEYLAGPDPAYEVKKYLNQRLEQLSEKDPRLASVLSDVLDTLGKTVVNYNVFAQKGLSTAFTRSFLKSATSNGSLVTVQEINSGLMKRGTVDVVLQVEEHEQALFSLGLFAGGLGSFVSNSEQKEESQENEIPTAGMELDILDVGIRPFVFFSGQSELMGHYWSGSASERTPAFQAIVPTQYHSEQIPLASGFIAEIEVQGAVSFDLAGQIQLSLWSRNAQSLVDLKAGTVVQGGTKIRSGFVQSMADFSMTVEPKLELATDVDFSGPVSLCMRLSQPESVLRYQAYKVERVTGSRHKLRKTRRTRLHNPGRTYVLNRKNNEMCSKVFS